MKCTLRKVAEGIVATVEQSPAIGDYFIDTENKDGYNPIECTRDNDWESWHKIIASTIPNVGKEIDIFYNNYSKDTKEEVLNSIIGYEYDYTETETQIIIKL